MRKKRSKRTGNDNVKLEMTPMIDVVFQLLIFFIVTLKQEDILSHLDVSRPAPDPSTKEEEVQDLLTIIVHRDGFVLRGRRVTLGKLERHLTRLASYSTNISVIIKCTADSKHQQLIQLLDLCAKAELRRISVFSM